MLRSLQWIQKTLVHVIVLFRLSLSKTEDNLTNLSQDGLKDNLNWSWREITALLAENWPTKFAVPQFIDWATENSQLSILTDYIYVKSMPIYVANILLCLSLPSFL
jgi:hypothetical protein